MFGLFGKKTGATPPAEPQVLLQEVNPHGTLQAVVEASQSTVFMYLAGPQDSGFGMRSLWIGNLAPAPEGMDGAAMQRGEPPMNPAEHCADPAGRPVPHGSDLRVVWLPESNGVALYEADRILGIIPPWSGENGFDGYAADAKGMGPLAWELDVENVLIERFRAAEAYWSQWADDDPWQSVQDDLLRAYERALGPHSNYYAIDGGTWPPKALIRIPHGDAVVLATLGVSICPQPNVERFVEEYQPLCRVELGAALPASWDDTAIERFGAYLSGQSSLPWQNFVWLGAGHTVGCDAWLDPQYTSALLWPTHPALQDFELPPQFGDPARVLWFLPITGQEQGAAEKGGGEALVDALPAERWQMA